MRRFSILAMLALLTFAHGAYAVLPSEMLKDPALELRAREISKGLRCLVCQNESIDDSHADLAHDLRILVRQRLVAGDTDEQVRQYIVARYGNYVLLQPPFNTETVLLWGGPALFLLIAISLAFATYRRHNRAAALRAAAGAGANISDEDRKRLDALLDTDKDTAS